MSASSRQKQPNQKHVPTNKITAAGIVISMLGVVMLIAFALMGQPSNESSSVRERTESLNESNAVQAADTGNGTAPIQNSIAPNFETVALSGDKVSLDDYRGDVIVVNFWATWCPPCKAEMPDIDAYYAANKDKGLVVLAVNAHEDEATVRAFIESRGFSFPVLLDEEGTIVQQYRVRSFPTTLIIDRDGVIHYIHTGMISPAQLEQIIGPLL